MHLYEYVAWNTLVYCMRNHHQPPNKFICLFSLEPSMLYQLPHTANNNLQTKPQTTNHFPIELIFSFPANFPPSTFPSTYLVLIWGKKCKDFLGYTPLLAKHNMFQNHDEHASLKRFVEEAWLYTFLNRFLKTVCSCPLTQWEVIYFLR